MIKVLLTADFDPNYLSECLENIPLEVVQRPFIKTQISPFQKNTEVLLKNGHDSWIFTSKNAVKAYIQHYQHVPKPNKLACVGIKTKEFLENIGLKVDIFSPTNSRDLAKKIISERWSKRAKLLAGNKHLDMLPDALKEAGIELDICYLYQTSEQKVSLQLSDYQGFLFCSPSAVSSFHKQYGLHSFSAPLFAIGSTTAESIRKLGVENVLLAPEASLKSLLIMASEYYNTSNS